MEYESLRLLLIEDNPIDAKVVEAHLRRGGAPGVEVERVGLLSLGMARLRDSRFDAALLDLNLPDSMGLGTVGQLHASYPELPIVVLTSNGGDELALQAVHAGAEDYLSKSELEPKLLLRTIRYAIERAEHRRANQEYRDRAEKATRESERRYRELLAAVTNYSYSVKLEDGAPAATDHSWGCFSITGYTPEDYKADPYLWIKMVHPDDQETVRQYVAAILRGEKVRSIEHRIVRPDGAVRWLRNTIVPHHDNDRLVRYDGLVEDVTDRRRRKRPCGSRNSNCWPPKRSRSGSCPRPRPCSPATISAAVRTRPSSRAETSSTILRCPTAAWGSPSATSAATGSVRPC